MRTAISPSPLFEALSGAGLWEASARFPAPRPLFAGRIWVSWERKYGLKVIPCNIEGLGYARQSPG